MDRFRFLTAGESHGPTLGADRRGRARRARADRGRHRGRPRPASARLRARRAPDDRAGPGRDPVRRPARADARLADPAGAREPRLGELDQGHAGRAADRGGGGASSPRSRPGATSAATPITRVRPGHADLAGALKYGFNDVRNALERSSARETRRGSPPAGSRGRSCASSGIEVWSFTAEVGGVAVDPARATRSARRGRRLAPALPGPRRGGRDDRAGRRGAVERRHGRRRVRGRRPRGCRSGSGSTSTGTGAWTRRWPRP